MWVQCECVFRKTRNSVVKGIAYLDDMLEVCGFRRASDACSSARKQIAHRFPFFLPCQVDNKLQSAQKKNRIEILSNKHSAAYLSDQVTFKAFQLFGSETAKYLKSINDD